MIAKRTVRKTIKNEGISIDDISKESIDNIKDQIIQNIDDPRQKEKKYIKYGILWLLYF